MSQSSWDKSARGKGKSGLQALCATKLVGPENISIWEITCEAPGYAAIATREDLSRFRQIVRRTFNRIKEVHGEQREVLIFPAAPAACWIEFGRVWQPKAHRPMTIFDQSKDNGFLPRWIIE
ncbi:SAVED domain-containing protein [Paracoccus beibuensis]|uniref:SAVED domain-containing protein n=1 Tax=Paracoccus beibuensis TaxID=547602 RepID=UPI0038990633